MRFGTRAGFETGSYRTALNFDHMRAQTVLVYSTVNLNALTIHTARQQHNCYLTSSLDFESLARIPSISIPIRHGKCWHSHEIQRKKIAQLFHHSATTIVLDDVCVDRNMSNYYNVL